MGKIVNQTELSEIFGVSDVTIWEWQQQGLPVLERGGRGKSNRYDTSEVHGWIVQRELARAGKGESQRDREARLRGDMIELELAEKRGTLVPADQVGPVWESRVLAAAFYMTSRHSRLAGMLEATPGIEAKRELLKREDADFLTKLGVEGARMQSEVQAVLEKLAAGEAEAFLRRLSGHDEQQQQRPGGSAAPSG
jgi:terminase small subunit / prophage DNA-packing protein